MLKAFSEAHCVLSKRSASKNGGGGSRSERSDKTGPRSGTGPPKVRREPDKEKAPLGALK
ncbi:hypothetical protein Caka_2801 [Coraliomargarita akajimensis DSM 45221]|uniref:Uncharacterized protein n=1 Tax=Coraliomargarita akajimensis (strain DSM 45221 / IAM 15411 / JCM 23193 / KCTC 12865 / 04OKA010-24) TaxID=583355 RepID=D5EQK0_CORAD|nr:hypothetical protein Caka_2801 [Coraliomargarita akajimensis DSM 45221]